jgi:hypothetical protein
MIALVTVLFAFPLGFFLRHRLAAAATYATIYLWSFTFQTAYLTRAWAAGDHSAFSGQPDFGVGYGLVTGASHDPVSLWGSKMRRSEFTFGRPVAFWWSQAVPLVDLGKLGRL